MLLLKQINLQVNNLYALYLVLFLWDQGILYRRYKCFFLLYMKIIYIIH